MKINAKKVIGVVLVLALCAFVGDKLLMSNVTNTLSATKNPKFLVGISDTKKRILAYNGQISIIVGLKLGENPTEAEIAAAQNDVLQTLNSWEYSNYKPFKYIPHFGITVSLSGLAKLMSSDKVSSIENDELLGIVAGPN